MESSSHRSRTYVFTDNTSWSATKLSGTYTITKESLNLAENATDTEIFKTLDANVSHTDNIILITADKGKIMRETTLHYRGRILVITNSVKNAKDQVKAMEVFSKTKGFKNLSEKTSWYSHINISRSGNDLHINYEDVRGKDTRHKVRIRRNVF